MEVKGYEVVKTENGYDVNVTYKPTPRAAEAVARVAVWEDGVNLNYNVEDMGRKVRVTAAEQRRVDEIVGVAMRVMHRMLRQ